MGEANFEGRRQREATREMYTYGSSVNGSSTHLNKMKRMPNSTVQIQSSQQQIPGIKLSWDLREET